VATYWRPNGKNIHRLPGAGEDEEWGVRPDAGYEVKLDAAARKQLAEHRRDRDALRPDGKTPALDLNLDPQLKKAVEYLKQPAKSSSTTT
jgi:carboxyl-terminal processing protease